MAPAVIIAVARVSYRINLFSIDFSREYGP